MLKHAVCFVFVEDERESSLVFGVDKLVKLADRDAQDVPIEKNDAVEGLVLRCRSDIAVHGEVGEERGDGGGLEFGGIPVLVKFKEPVGPAELSLLGAEGTAAHADGGPHSFEEIGDFGGSGSLGFTGRLACSEANALAPDLHQTRHRSRDGCAPKQPRRLFSPQLAVHARQRQGTAGGVRLWRLCKPWRS